jgi:hypothetical protein
MAFIDAAIAVGSAVGLEGTAAAIGGGALMAGGAGALAGGLYNGLTGRSVLNGALYGGLIGGIGGATAGYGLGAGSTAVANSIAAGMGYTDAISALGAGVAPEALGLASGSTAASLAGTTAAKTLLPTITGTDVPAAAPVQAAGSVYDPMQASQEGYTLPPSPAPYDPMQASQEGYVLNPETPQAPGLNTTSTFKTPALFSGIGDFVKAHPYATAAGVGGLGYLLGSSGKSLTQPNYLPTYTPPTAASYGLGRTLSPNYRATRPMAEGGIAALGSGGSLQKDPINVDFMGGDMYPTSQQHRSYYATPTQAPTGAQEAMASYEPKTNPLTGQLTANMAFGGLTAAGETGLQGSSQAMNPMYIRQLASQFNTTPELAQRGLQALQSVGITKASGGSVGSKYNLGSYSDGGRLLKGPGDGMSDGIPASIADKQPARLADGEFVVPADVVSHLGNGSTDAGAKHLYKMMDNVRKARTGRKSQGKEIKAGKYLPK